MIKFDPFWTDLIKSDQKKIENWKSDDIFQWLFHQKLKMWKKWKIWDKRLQSEKSILRAFARTRAKNPIWSSLIKFDPFWSILTDLIKSDQKIYKEENLMIYFNDYLIRNQIRSSLIKFWSILDRSHSIWSKKNWRLIIWWDISMIISSEIENVEKVENLSKKIDNGEKHFKSFR